MVLLLSPSANSTSGGIYIKRESELHIVLLDQLDAVALGKAASFLKRNDLLKMFVSLITLDNNWNFTIELDTTSQKFVNSMYFL